MQTVGLSDDEVSIDWDGIVRSGDDALRIVPKITGVKQFSDSLLLLKLGHSECVSDPDIVVPEHRNLVGIGPGPRHAWTIEPPCDPESIMYKEIDIIGGRIIARTDTNHCHDIDHETGEILDDWPGTEFRIGDTTVSFPEGEIAQVELFDGILILQTTEPNLFGFDADGTKLWERLDDPGWGLNPKEGRFILYRVPTRRKKMAFRLDTVTGKIVEQTYGGSYGEKYVDE